MNTDLALGRALEAIAHLADPEPPWADILESAAGLIGSDSSAFLMFDGSGALTTFQHRNMDLAGERDYVDHFHRQDIITPVAVHLPEGAWLDTQERFSSATLSRNGYYVDFMCKYQMRQMLTFVVEQSPQRRAALTFHRAVPADHARRLLESRQVRTLTTALQQALARRRDAATHWLESAESAFEAFDEATCLVTDTGAVLRLSPKAEELLGNGSALHVRCGRLWHPATKVREALARALARASTGNHAQRIAVTGERDASCSLELVRADPRLRLGNEAMVFIRIRRNPAPGEVSVEALCVAFDITRAEARVLAALIEGQSPAEHARAHGVSIETVRTQITMLRDKMGCRRQVDLVRAGLAAL